MNNEKETYDLAVGLSRLKADATNLQSGKVQKQAYIKEQRRDVSNMLIYLSILFILGLNLQMLLYKNLAYSIVSIPFIINI